MLARQFMLKPASLVKPRFFSSASSQLKAAFARSKHSYQNSYRKTSSRIGLSLGLAGVSSLIAIQRNPLHNDSVTRTVQAQTTNAFNTVDENLNPTKKKPRFDGAFGGKLNYTHLSIGSMFGLVIGLCVGKLSSLFVFISLGIYLSIQFLNKKGIISISTTKFVKVGDTYVDIRDMVMEQPSFNIPFVLSFLIGAYNA